jgi:hypothetical protein
LLSVASQGCGGHEFVAGGQQLVRCVDMQDADMQARSVLFSVLLNATSLLVFVVFVLFFVLMCFI